MSPNRCPTFFQNNLDSNLFVSAIRTSISDDWSSTGFMDAAAELECSTADREKYKEKRDKERQKERAKVEKEKENDEGKYL